MQAGRWVLHEIAPPDAEVNVNPFPFFDKEWHLAQTHVAVPHMRHPQRPTWRDPLLVLKPWFTFDPGYFQSLRKLQQNISTALCAFCQENRGFLNPLS